MQQDPLADRHVRGGRPAAMRADAERNRERVMDAARALYATHGLDISMAAVARRAGVGKATLSRHFGSPDELIDAVFTDRMNAYVQATLDAVRSSDPWGAFVDYLWKICEMQANDRGFADLVTLSFPAAKVFEERRAQAYHGFLQIIQRAQSTGNLQSDFRSEDLVVLLMANGGVISATAHAAPDAWRRLVGQMIRAFSTPQAPGRTMPAAPTSVELTRAMRRARLATANQA